MLVIRRRAGEAVLIGDNIEVRVLEIGGSSVKIGIEAPKNVAVVRREIQITAVQNRSALQLGGASLPDTLKKLRERRGEER